jgi:hypothetical protein
MKKLIFPLLFLGATGAFANNIELFPNILYIEAPNGTILEMPVHQETEEPDVIPGHKEKPGTFYGTIDPDHLSRILLCMSKPEQEEPIPSDIL